MFGRNKKPTQRKTARRGVRRKKSTKLEWEVDGAAQDLVYYFATTEYFQHIQPDRIFCYRTTGSQAHAYARIWSFPKIFQQALEIPPAYVIECLSEKFDRLDVEEQKKVIIHELLHIPKNFSGSLLPHKYGKKEIHTEVTKIYKSLKV